MAVSTATWRWALADQTLATKAFLAKPAEASYTRRRNGYCEVRLAIDDPEDAVALEAAAYTRVLRAWRNGVNIFNGTVLEPEETASTFTVGAKGPYHNLAWRRVRAAVAYSGISDGAIVTALLALQNGYRATGLRMGTVATTETRSGATKFAAGDRVDDAIEHLARYTDGFAFVEDAVDGVASVLAELTIHRPYDVARPKARFEFGPGTAQTLDDYARRTRPLINRKTVIGEDNDVATWESTTSPPLHGLWEDERGHVTTAGSDEALARFALEGGSDTPVYELSLAPNAEAPQLFTDFDVIHAVPVLIRRRGTTIVNATLPVQEATIALDRDSGTELLDELVVDLAAA